MKSAGAKTVWTIMIIAALGLFLAALLTSCVGDDTTDIGTPTGPGGGGPYGPPISGATPVINPSVWNITIPTDYGGGASFYFFVNGGSAPYIWDHAITSFGNLTPIDRYSDGIYRQARYTLRAFNGTGEDTVIVTDGNGLTATATVNIAAGSPDTLAVIPSSVTIGNATGGESIVFRANGGIGPYDWANALHAIGNILFSDNTSEIATYTVANPPVAGTDTVILHDQTTGARVTASVTVTLPGAPAILSINAVSSMDENASAVVSASGGTPFAYGYNWSIISGSTYAHLSANTGTSITLIGNNANGSSDQTVTLQVIDSVGATATANISIKNVP